MNKHKYTQTNALKLFSRFCLFNGISYAQHSKQSRREKLIAIKSIMSITYNKKIIFFLALQCKVCTSAHTHTLTHTCIDVRSAAWIRSHCFFHLRHSRYIYFYRSVHHHSIYLVWTFTHSFNRTFVCSSLWLLHSRYENKSHTAILESINFIVH